jgi:hypothetical protein
VEVDVVVIESGDVAIAIAEEVSKHGINKLVQSMLFRKESYIQIALEIFLGY